MLSQTSSQISQKQKYQKMSTLQRFKSIILREPARFIHRGYGKLFAIFQLFSMFVLLPKLLTLMWPTVLANLPHGLIFLLGILLANFLTVMLYNLIFLVIYKIKHPFFEKYKVFQGPWPWQTDYKKWRQLLKKSILNLGLNLFVIGPVFILLDMQKNFFFKFSMQQIPDTLTIVWQVFIFMLGQDLTFYILHSRLHHPKFYWIHKTHHEYNRTVSIAAQYSHPIQFICNCIGFGIGYKILHMFYPVHVFTIIVWTVFRMIETTQGHSGYEWTFSYTSVFPIGGGPQYHDFHHSKNSGNYGSYFIFWDTLFGTNKQYFKWKRQQQQKSLLLNQQNKKSKEKRRVISPNKASKYEIIMKPHQDFIVKAKQF